MEGPQQSGDSWEKTTVFTQDLIGNFIDNETNTAVALVRKLETDFDVTVEQTTHADIHMEKENSTAHVLATKGYHSWTVGEKHRLRLIKTSLVQCHAGVVVNVSLEQKRSTHTSGNVELFDLQIVVYRKKCMIDIQYIGVFYSPLHVITALIFY